MHFPSLQLTLCAAVAVASLCPIVTGSNEARVITKRKKNANVKFKPGLTFTEGYEAHFSHPTPKLIVDRGRAAGYSEWDGKTSTK